MRFRVGDHVKPKPEWIGDPNEVPTGAIRAIELWGKGQALYVGTERRAFGCYVFDPDPEPRML